MQGGASRGCRLPREPRPIFGLVAALFVGGGERSGPGARPGPGGVVGSELFDDVESGGSFGIEVEDSTVRQLVESGV